MPVELSRIVELGPNTEIPCKPCHSDVNMQPWFSTEAVNLVLGEKEHLCVLLVSLAIGIITAGKTLSLLDGPGGVL